MSAMEYQKGWEAARQGKPIGACPYLDNRFGRQLRLEWQRGWLAAQVFGDLGKTDCAICGQETQKIEYRNQLHCTQCGYIEYV